jgi:hypothetical protein
MNVNSCGFNRFELALRPDFDLAPPTGAVKLARSAASILEPAVAMPPSALF